MVFVVQLASTGLADITGPVSTLFLGLSIPILVLFLRLKSKRTSWCGCQVGGIEPWLRVAAIALVFLAFSEMALETFVSATTISPASTKATFEIASLVISQATQAFSHILLIYVAVRVRGGGRWNLVLAVAMGALSLSSAAIGSLAGRQVVLQTVGMAAKVEGVTAVAVALLIDLMLCIVLFVAEPTRFADSVLSVVALIQAGGISFWVTQNEWTFLLVLPLTNLYLVAVLLALLRTTETYSIRNRLCVHTPRDRDFTRTSFVMTGKRLDEKANLTTPATSETVSSRWSRDTVNARSARKLFSPIAIGSKWNREAKGKQPSQGPLPPVSNLVGSRAPYPASILSQDPYSDSYMYSDAPLPAPHNLPTDLPAALYPGVTQSPTQPFVSSRPYPLAPSNSTGTRGANRPWLPTDFTPLSPAPSPDPIPIPPSSAPSPVPFQNLNPSALTARNLSNNTPPPPPPPQTATTLAQLDRTPEAAAEILGLSILRMSQRYSIASATGSFSEAPLEPPGPLLRLTNPYSPLPLTPTSLYPSSPLNVGEEEDDEGRFARQRGSARSSGVDPELDGLPPTVVVVPVVPVPALALKRGKGSLGTGRRT